MLAVLPGPLHALPRPDATEVPVTKPIRIGAALGLTGPDAVLAQQAREAIELAIEISILRAALTDGESNFMSWTIR